MAIEKENKVVHGDDLTMIGQQIKNYAVKKEAGKGLSTNDFTDALKNKLDGITAGAEPNVNADWDAVSGDAQILHKPSIPSKTSDLTNDSGFITASDVPEGAAASSTVPKMDGTAAVGSETAFARGDHRHPTDTSRAPLASPSFTGTPTAPTAESGTNTTQIATTAFVKTAVDAMKASLPSVYTPKGSKATYAELPSTGNTVGDVWNVVAAYGDYPPGTNWAWTSDGTWDPLGGSVDLSNYVTTDTLEALTSQEVIALLNLS